jgi:hypothetical protein
MVNLKIQNPMLDGRDPETGEKMSEENIRHNMVTFLVCCHTSHEYFTTS